MTTMRPTEEPSLAPPTPGGQVLTHRNRRGERYYLHEGQTKTGKSRYFFAKTLREGALAEMPEGYEVTESINAVVSVRRTKNRPDAISANDLQLAQDELRRHPHLRHYQARVKARAIVIYEPHKARYYPVMKFEQQADGYALHRMTYSGHGGWSYPMRHGSLESLVRKYALRVGTDEFFDVY